MKALEEFEQKSPSTRAYVFVTNFSFHRDLAGPPRMSESIFGLAMPDVNLPGYVNVKDSCRRRLKHVDAYRIAHAM